MGVSGTAASRGVVPAEGSQEQRASGGGGANGRRDGSGWCIAGLRLDEIPN